MPSERAPGRKSISVWLDEDLLKAVEHACVSNRLDRSQFLRDAVIGHLRALGYPPEAFASFAMRQQEALLPIKRSTARKLHLGKVAPTAGSTSTPTFYEARKPPTGKYAKGTIGRNARQRNFIAYLLGQYYEFKKADVGFGADPVEHARIINGLYPIMNNTIRKLFGSFPNGLPADQFPALVAYLEAKILGTRLGKKQNKAGRKCFTSFEEFCALGAQPP